MSPEENELLRDLKRDADRHSKAAEKHEAKALEHRRAAERATKGAEYMRKQSGS